MAYGTGVQKLCVHNCSQSICVVYYQRSWVSTLSGFSGARGEEGASTKGFVAIEVVVACVDGCIEQEARLLCRFYCANFISVEY